MATALPSQGHLHWGSLQYTDWVTDMGRNDYTVVKSWWYQMVGRDTFSDIYYNKGVLNFTVERDSG